MLVLAAYELGKGDRYSLDFAAADALRRIHETLGVLGAWLVRIPFTLLEATLTQYLPRSNCSDVDSQIAGGTNYLFVASA